MCLLKVELSGMFWYIFVVSNIYVVYYMLSGTLNSTNSTMVYLCKTIEVYELVKVVRVLSI